MPLSYQQNKKHIYNWKNNNPEKERENVIKGTKNYYDKNREIINMKTCQDKD
jgi:hypothetical protein